MQFKKICVCVQNNLAYFPFMHCPLVANWKMRWSINVPLSHQLGSEITIGCLPVMIILHNFSFQPMAYHRRLRWRLHNGPHRWLTIQYDQRRSSCTFRLAETSLRWPDTHERASPCPRRPVCGMGLMLFNVWLHICAHSTERRSLEFNHEWGCCRSGNGSKERPKAHGRERSGRSSATWPHRRHGHHAQQIHEWTVQTGWSEKCTATRSFTARTCSWTFDVKTKRTEIFVFVCAVAVTVYRLLAPGEKSYWIFILGAKTLFSCKWI